MFALLAVAYGSAAAAFAASAYILYFALRGVAMGPQRSGRVTSLPRFTVLVPAHNESAGIDATLRSILAADWPGERLRLITIADNCSDDTAAVARAAGAEVWKRTDAEQRGKGYALAWALTQLPADSFDMVVVIDADTVVAADFFHAMAAEHTSSPGAVLQGLYSFAPASSSPFDTLSVASKAAENSFIYRPRSAMGLVCLLQGNGFCIPSDVLRLVPFTASGVVEDAEYALQLAAAGVPVAFVEGAHVTSRMTATASDAAPQRLRWASGVFQLMAVSVPRLIAQAVRKRSARLAEAALMLLCTSRVTVAALTFLAFVLSFLLAWVSGAVLPLVLASAAVAMQAVYIVLMFRRGGSTPFPLRPLLYAPFYLLFIVAVQLAAFTGMRKNHWSRTVR